MNSWIFIAASDSLDINCCSVEVAVTEKNEVGLTLGILTAMDRDAGENASLHFAVRRCIPSKLTPVIVTSLNSTSAAITAGMSYDHETHGSSLHQCLISVCDCGTVTSLCADDVIVRVHVTDAADRRPLFDKTGGYQFSVHENQPAGTLVGTCKTTICIIGRLR